MKFSNGSVLENEGVTESRETGRNIPIHLFYSVQLLLIFVLLAFLELHLLVRISASSRVNQIYWSSNVFPKRPSQVKKGSGSITYAWDGDWKDVGHSVLGVTCGIICGVTLFRGTGGTMRTAPFVVTSDTTLFFVSLWAYAVYDAKHTSSASQCGNFASEYAVPFVAAFYLGLPIIKFLLHDKAGSDYNIDSAGNAERVQTRLAWLFALVVPLAVSCDKIYKMF